MLRVKGLFKGLQKGNLTLGVLLRFRVQGVRFGFGVMGFQACTGRLGGLGCWVKGFRLRMLVQLII